MTIRAHLGDSAAQGRSRRTERRKLQLPVQGSLPSGDGATVLIHNASAEGMLLECEKGLAEGEAIELDLPQAGVTTAKIVWHSGNLFGCRFEKRLPAAALSALHLRSPFVGDASAGRPQTVESFGKLLKRLRMERRLTMDDLAEHLAVSKTTIWAWEQGNSKPLPERILSLASVLGVAPDVLVPSTNASALQEILLDSREKIAVAFGTSRENVRIMIEL